MFLNKKKKNFDINSARIGESSFHDVARECADKLFESTFNENRLFLIDGKINSNAWPPSRLDILKIL